MTFTPLDATTLKNSIPLECGDYATVKFPGGVITDNLPTIWNMFAEKGVYDIMLQYLYAKRKAIDYLIGDAKGKVNRGISSFRIAYGELVTNLQIMQKDIDGEIVERQMSVAIPPVVQIAQVAPIMPRDVVYSPPHPFTPIDANDPRIQGSPYLAPWWWR